MSSCVRWAPTCGLSWSSRMSTSRSEEHTSELQSHVNLVCRLLLEKKNGRSIRIRNGNFRRVRSGLGVRVARRRSFPRRPVAEFPFFFFNATATTEIYTLSLHDALPISPGWRMSGFMPRHIEHPAPRHSKPARSEEHTSELQSHVNLVCRLLLEKNK